MRINEQQPAIDGTPETLVPGEQAFFCDGCTFNCGATIRAVSVRFATFGIDEYSAYVDVEAHDKKGNSSPQVRVRVDTYDGGIGTDELPYVETLIEGGVRECREPISGKRNDPLGYLGSKTRGCGAIEEIDDKGRVVPKLGIRRI